MSSSDSEDDMYSNYMEKRKAKVLNSKNKFAKPNTKSSFTSKTAAITLSDDDDDEAVEPLSSIVRRKRKNLSDDDEDDDDDEFSTVVKAKKTHSEYLEERKKQSVRDYASDMKSSIEYSSWYKKDDNHRSMPTAALDRAYKLCDDMDNGCIQLSRSPSPLDETLDMEADLASGQYTGSLPVSIEVADMEVFSNGCFKMDVKMDSSFDEMISRLADKWKCKQSDVILKYNNCEIDSSGTPSSLGFKPLQFPNPRFDAYKKHEIFCPDDVIETAHGGKDIDLTVVSIKVRLVSLRKPIEMTLKKETTVKELHKLVLETLEKHENENYQSCISGQKTFRLIMSDEALDDEEETLESLDIENDDCIDVFMVTKS